MNENFIQASIVFAPIANLEQYLPITITINIFSIRVFRIDILSSSQCPALSGSFSVNNDYGSGF